MPPHPHDGPPVSTGASPNSAKPERRGDGRLLAEISSSIVAIFRDHYGRGPMRAKTHAVDDLIVVVLRDTGFTAFEQTMLDHGDGDGIIALRQQFQRAMAVEFRATIERLTGRTVLAFLSQAHLDPDVTTELFVLDEPLFGPGDGKPG